MIREGFDQRAISFRRATGVLKPFDPLSGAANGAAWNTTRRCNVRTKAIMVAGEHREKSRGETHYYSLDDLLLFAADSKSLPIENIAGRHVGTAVNLRVVDDKLLADIPNYDGKISGFKVRHEAGQVFLQSLVAVDAEPTTEFSASAKDVYHFTVSDAGAGEIQHFGGATMKTVDEIRHEFGNMHNGEHAEIIRKVQERLEVDDATARAVAFSEEVQAAPDFTEVVKKYAVDHGVSYSAALAAVMTPPEETDKVVEAAERWCRDNNLDPKVFKNFRRALAAVTTEPETESEPENE